MQYYAHSRDGHPVEEWEPLAEHLMRVAGLAEKNAAGFQGDVLGYVVGLLHDLGKYKEDFQRRLRGEAIRAPHAIDGAALAVERYGKQLGKLLGLVIAAHHAGLPDGVEGGRAATLEERLNGVKTDPGLLFARAGIALPDNLTVPQLDRCQGRTGFQRAFLIRMLLSCLVDADRTATAAVYHEWEHGLPMPEKPPPDWDLIGKHLDDYLARFKEATGRLNRLRGDILSHVRKQADARTGLFSLDVPTGGGKTLTSLAFAIDHARAHGLKRIVYVIPFVSIIDQTAKIFRDILPEGVVLEHHSGIDLPDDPEADRKLRAAQENWDAEIIVTTSVQFFESLFSNRPGATRKINKLCNSVVIMDEAQVLPLHLLNPCVAALDELARNYGSSIVLCTATQPALNRDLWQNTAKKQILFSDVRELAPEPTELHEQLKRVHLVNLQEVADAELIERLMSHKQVLCIVNTRAHARKLYELLPEDSEAHFYLTTLLCPVHRLQKLEAIRQRLKTKQPCRAVATSLVEAGVDLDFGAVYRAECGLDSLIQAAGRCNRENNEKLEDSPVFLFRAPDVQPPKSIRPMAAAMNETLRHFADPFQPEAIRHYFQGVYFRADAAELDKHHVIRSCQERSDTLDFPFETIARKFRLIENNMVTLFIPHEEEAEAALQQLPDLEGDQLRRAVRLLQRHQVQIPRDAMQELLNAKVVDYVAKYSFEDRFPYLLNLDIYTEKSGFNWDDPTFRHLDSMNF